MRAKVVAMVAVGAPGYLLTVACLGLLGVGVTLLSVDGPIFGGTLAGPGLKTLAFGLVGDFVMLGLLAVDQRVHREQRHRGREERGADPSEADRRRQLARSRSGQPR